MGLKSVYAAVASQVESVAKSQGYAVDLGSKSVAASVRSGNSGGGGWGSQSHNGYESMEPHMNGGASNGPANFAGFDDGIDSGD